MNYLLSPLGVRQREECLWISLSSVLVLVLLHGLCKSCSCAEQRLQQVSNVLARINTLNLRRRGHEFVLYLVLNVGLCLSLAVSLAIKIIARGVEVTFQSAMDSL